MRDSLPPIGKLPILRWVCAPQRDAAGISRDPKESDSVRAGRALAGLLLLLLLVMVDK